MPYREKVKDTMLQMSGHKIARDHADVKAALTTYAARERITVSEALRYLVREALRERGHWPPQAPTGRAGG